MRAAEADFDFHPVKTWLGKPITERVEGWLTEVRSECGGCGVVWVAVQSGGTRCWSTSMCCCAPGPPQVYECSGSLVAAACRKVPVVLPPGATFEEYLALQLPEDEVEEVPLDLPAPADAAAASSLSGSAGGGGGGGGSSSDSVDLFATTAAAAAAAGPSRSKKKASKKAQKFSSRCWLARGFPVLLTQV